MLGLSAQVFSAPLVGSWSVQRELTSGRAATPELPPTPMPHHPLVVAGAAVVLPNHARPGPAVRGQQAGGPGPLPAQHALRSIDKELNQTGLARCMHASGCLQPFTALFTGNKVQF